MVKRCKRAGVEIIVDAVLNHMAAGSEGKGVAGSSYTNRNFPDYDQTDFHHTTDLDTNCEVSDYTNQQNVQECDLVGLADLDTGSKNVQDTIARYLNYLSSMGVGGFRLDAAKHQEVRRGASKWRCQGVDERELLWGLGFIFKLFPSSSCVHVRVGLFLSKTSTIHIHLSSPPPPPPPPRLPKSTGT